MKLYDAPRSSACYRVRNALNLKGIEYERVPVDLVTEGGEQHRADYLATNPQGLVPTLCDGDLVLRQSLAIIEYLDETVPDPPLLPPDPAGRARVRGLTQLVACDVHPLNNLRVMRYLEETLEVGDESRLEWYRHWIAVGLGALEAILSQDSATGTYCHGEAVSLADVCVVPQLFNARRYECPLDGIPTLCRIDAACGELPAFRAAHPEAGGSAGQGSSA